MKSKEQRKQSLTGAGKIFLCLTQFLYGSANACYYSFLSIWLSYEGFTYSQIGYVRGLSQLTILLLVPVLCLLIDLISNNNVLIKQLLLAAFCITVAGLRLLFIYWEHSWNLIFCALIVITIAIQESMNSTMDSIILSMIPDPNKYGRYRLWAGFGWGIVAFILGIVFDHYLTVDSMFYFFCGFMSSLGLLWLIPTLRDMCCAAIGKEHKSSLLINKSKSEEYPNQIKLPFHRKLYLFLSQLDLFKLQIIFSIFVLGISFGVINTFLFLRLQELGASTMLMGVTLVVTICSEMPAFLLVDRALVTIGDLGIVCVGLMAYMLRLGWYGLLGFHGIMTNPWYVMPAEALHGLTYAWIKASIAVFAHRLANEDRMKSENMKIDLSSFSQGFLSAIFNGFGQGTGGAVGGIVFATYGPHYLFFGNALGLLPFFIIFVIQFFCCRKKMSVTSSHDLQR